MLIADNSAEIHLLLCFAPTARRKHNQKYFCCRAFSIGPPGDEQQTKKQHSVASYSNVCMRV